MPNWKHSAELITREIDRLCRAANIRNLEHELGLLPCSDNSCVECRKMLG